MAEGQDRNQQGAEPPASGGGATPSTATTGRHLPGWAAAAATFVAGLLLGGVVVAAVQSGGDDEAPQAAASASPSPSPSPSPTPAGNDVLIRVPGACVEAAEEAETAVQGFDELAAAARDFDARELSDAVDRLQELRPRLETLSRECQDAATEDIVAGDLISPAPVPTT